MMTMPPFVPYPPLLPHLHALIDSGDLRKLWADESAWQSLSIDYHPPRVERLFTSYASRVNNTPLRVMLHRLHPCDPGRALWHAHPWPSAVQLLSGRYEHATGFLDKQGHLHRGATSILHAGDSYEITDPLAWHYVRPLGEPAYSVMIAGAPWAKHSAPKPAPQRPLIADEIEDLRLAFGDLLAWSDR